MCGILGSNFLDESSLRILNDLQNHRGPDQTGIYSDADVGLAHKRLSILDLSEKGRQPMADSTGSYVIVYNGEVFNYGELKKELAGKGYSFVSNTDTEVILNSYIEWGRNCVERFNGQFAFCIYDRKKNEFFLARDRLGIKPLYFFSDLGRFIFGSELKVILKAGIEREIDEEALNHYLIFGYTPSESSILKNVYKLLPGHYLVYDIEKKSISESRKYWEINFSDKIHSEEEAKETLYGLLDSSVKRRLIADVPVGAFLSGGVDSSIIVYLMRKYVKDLKTFSIKFDHDEFNESKWARLVADRLDTDHHEIEFNAVDVKKLIPDLVYLFDEPFGDSSMIPTYLVSRAAKEHVTVCLSGTGADELFGGYHRYREFSQLRKLSGLPSVIKRMIVSGYSLYNGDKANKLKQLINEAEDATTYIKLLSYLFRDEKEIRVDLDGISNLKEHFDGKTGLSGMLNFDQHEYLPNDLLVKEDRASLGVSLEARVPFLDHTLVEYANSLSSGLKIRKGEGKYILKKTFEGRLPKEILYREKKGFGVPLMHYFRNELKDFAYHEIFESDVFPYYDKEVVGKMWRKHQNGNSDYSRLFWSIIMFNMWYGKWMK